MEKAWLTRPSHAGNRHNRQSTGNRAPGWYGDCLFQGMHIETRTKNLARAVFIFSAASICAVLTCMALAGRQKVSAPVLSNSPLYTYQNPFSIADDASTAGFLEPKTASIWAGLTSLESLSGLAGLAVLWLTSTWYLHGSHSKKRIERHGNHATSAKMNPLAILPKPAVHEQKEDIFRPLVLGRTIGLRRLAHRETTAPCQSRFRPVTLVASQVRFGRLE